MNPKAQQALDKLLDLFQSGNIPEALSITLLPRLDVPSARWSICNRLLMFLSGTEDARGFRQWEMVGRWPRKGAKAFHIICPKIIQKEKQDGTREPALVGFKGAPVFAFEDTEGEELDIQHLPPKELPPLYEVAERWGIGVEWKGSPGAAVGVFSPSQKSIALCTYDESVFLHELAHAAHQKVAGDLTRIEIWKKEVVAELSAAVLANLYGKKKANTGSHYRYIEDYAQDAGLDVYKACLAVASDVSECLDLILSEEKKKEAA